MNARRLTLLSALLVLVAVIAASAVPQSEALAEGDLHIDTIDGNDLSLTLDSGTSETVNLYVTNKGDTPVALSVDSVSGLGDSISVSTKITVLDSVNPDSGVLMPAGHDGNMAIIEITVSADSYSDNKIAVGTVTLLANSIGDGEGGVEIANDEGSVFFSVFEPSGVTYDVGRNKGATSKHVSDLSIGESEECYLYLPGYEDNEPVSYSRATKRAGVCLGNYVFSDLFGGDTVYAYFDEYVYPEE